MVRTALVRRAAAVRWAAGAMLALVVALPVVLSGCMFDRPKPVPQYVVTVQPDVNLYQLDGRPLAYDQLQTELRSIADKNRQSATGNARAYVKIVTQPGASWDRTIEVVDFCATVGLDKIETTGR